VDVTVERAPATLSAGVTASRRLATFSVLAALAVVAWHAQTKPLFRLDLQTVGFLLAVVVLLRPFSRVAFLSLAAVETLTVLIILPLTNTNRLLQLFVFATLTATGFYVLARSGFRKLDAGAWLQVFQPLLRLQLVIVYGLAAWHKLNFGFFDPQSSCAVILYERTPFFHLHANGNLLRWGLILGTVATEMGLPILLSLRRTRNFAVCYGVLFHVALGFSEFYSFSVTMIALLFLFTPDNFVDVAAEFWQGRSPWFRKVVTFGGLAMLIMVVVLTAAVFGPSVAEVRQVTGFQSRLNMVWSKAAYWSGYWILLFYLPPLGLFAWLWYRSPASLRPATHSFRPIPPLFWVFPALLIFDGINPYLGLKTDTAFAMYSNLRTEGGTTNHLIWRHPFSLADYQEDLVQIVDSSDPKLKAAAGRGVPITFFDLQKRTSYLVKEGGKNISVTYIRNGKLTQVEAAETDPELATRPPLLARKFLLFRTISREGCPH
jgi:hypothetical protein